MKRSVSPPQAVVVDSSWRIGIVVSPYYAEEAQALVDSARTALLAAGIKNENIERYDVHGSFEIPLVGAALAESGAVDALIGIGIIVEGGTHHAELLAKSVAQGMMDVQVQWGIPFGFEVLYVKSLDQARERSARGAEAASAVLQALATMRKLAP